MSSAAGAVNRLIRSPSPPPLLQTATSRPVIDARRRSRTRWCQLIRQSTIFLLEPLTDAARAWAEEHLPADRLTFGAAIVVEHRCIANIVTGIAIAGLTVDQV